MISQFDPSLLYAECRRCGAPVLGTSTPCEALLWMGIPPASLAADCLLLYEECPNCSPGKKVYEPRFIRFTRQSCHQAVH